MAKPQKNYTYHEDDIIPMQVLPSFQDLANDVKLEEQAQEDISERGRPQQYVLAQPNQAGSHSPKIQKNENKEKKYTPVSSILVMAAWGFSMVASILIPAGPVIIGTFFLAAGPISMAIAAIALFAAGIACAVIALACLIAAWKVDHAKKESANAPVAEPKPVEGTYSKLHQNEGLQPKQTHANVNEVIIDLQSHDELFSKKDKTPKTSNSVQDNDLTIRIL